MTKSFVNACACSRVLCKKRRGLGCENPASLPSGGETSSRNLAVQYHMPEGIHSLRPSFVLLSILLRRRECRRPWQGQCPDNGLFAISMNGHSTFGREKRRKRLSPSLGLSHSSLPPSLPPSSLPCLLPTSRFATLSSLSPPCFRPSFAVALAIIPELFYTESQHVRKQIHFG